MSKTYTMWTLTNSHGKIVEHDGSRLPMFIGSKYDAKRYRVKPERVTKVKVTVKKVKPHA